MLARGLQRRHNLTSLKRIRIRVANFNCIAGFGKSPTRLKSA